MMMKAIIVMIIIATMKKGNISKSRHVEKNKTNNNGTENQ